MPLKTPSVHRIGRIVLVVGLAAILILTCTPLSNLALDAQVADPWCLVCGDEGLADVIRNLVLFMPIGAGLAMTGVRSRRAMIIGAGLSLLVESLQFFVIPGRFASVSDLLTNTASTGLGIALARVWRSLAFCTGQTARNFALASTSAMLSVGIATQWLVAPSWKPPLRSNTCPPPPPRLATFRGTLLREVHEESSATPRAVRAAISVTKLSRPLVPERIGALCTAEGVESAVLVHERTRIVGRIRWRASDFRLRQVDLRLPHRATEIDTVLVALEATPAWMRLSASTIRGGDAVTLQLDHLSGWLLLLPYPSFWGSERREFLRWGWVVLLVTAPVWWSRRAYARSRLGGAVLGACCGVIIVAVPPLFAGHLPSPSPPWLVVPILVALASLYPRPTA